MGNAVSKNGDLLNQSYAYDHIYVREYREGPDDYGWIDARVNGNINSGSQNVFVNGVAVARKGDTTSEDDTYSLGGWDYAYPSYVHSNATGSISGGSPTVYVNGSPIARQNDNYTNHAGQLGTIAGGSSNVFAG